MKYQRSTILGSKDIANRKSEFVAKSHGSFSQIVWNCFVRFLSPVIKVINCKKRVSDKFSQSFSSAWASNFLMSGTNLKGVFAKIETAKKLSFKVHIKKY